MTSKRNLMLLGLLTPLLISCSRQGSDCLECDALQERYLHKYGVPISQKEWKVRGKSGQVVSTLKSGVVVTKQYENGTLEGEATYTFPHETTIEKMESYLHGEKMKEIWNYPSGLPMEELDFSHPEQLVVTSWYESGSPRSREVYDSQDRLVDGSYLSPNRREEARVDLGEGTRVNRDNLGALISTDEMLGGRVAITTKSYPTGTPSEIIPFVGGEVEGIRKTFYPDGGPKSVEEWVAGERHGQTLLYNNGEKVAREIYVRGVKQGTEERYKDGEFVVQEISWKEGKRSGPTTTYIDGTSHVTWYLDDKEVTKRQYLMRTHPAG